MTTSNTEPKAGTNLAAVLAIIIVSDLMILLDISVVLTGLTHIQHDLGFSDAGLSWVESAYTLTFGGFLLLGARAGGILGQRRMFLSSLALFTAASVAVGFAPSAALMLAARAIQGLGAAVLAPTTLALLQTHFTQGPARTRAVAYYSAVAGIGASLGLVVGGVLADWLSWRVGFLINLPIGLAMMWATPRFLKESERLPGQFDVLGASTSTLGMSALVYAMIRSAEVGWSDHLTWVSLAAAVVLLGLFVIIEWRAEQPIMPLRLFANRRRVGAYATRVVFMAATIGFFFFTTLLLQRVLNYTALWTGVAFLPATLTSFLTAMAVPNLSKRFGDSALLACGLGLCFFGLAWLCNVSAGTSYLYGVALPMAVFGIGQGVVFSPLTAFGIADVADADAGAASGVVNVTHHLGISVGLGLLVAVSSIGGQALVGQELLTSRIGTALTAAAALLLVALILALALIVLPDQMDKRRSPQVGGG